MGPRRAPPGPQAAEQESVGTQRRERERERERPGRGPPPLQVDLPLFLRASGNRGGPLADPTHGVNTEVFSMALSHFAEQVGAGKDKRILLVLDQAGWYTSPRVEVPEGIELEFLPSNSPELQPSERLWPLTNEGYPTATTSRRSDLWKEPSSSVAWLCAGNRRSSAPTLHYHWWPEAA